ncbi:hypothetical protein PhCBS80983_g02521 [Powellomyces hirtus]|uniref:Uncharacterized protein n=1 Tax=Powellomyces hirtus TaxID=109895 RepID=A0A507E7J5_9FUNG|nr:hypothetical protein PhCBS80983_g02521 [Powellomyces hirtus]
MATQGTTAKPTRRAPSTRNRPIPPAAAAETKPLPLRKTARNGNPAVKKAAPKAPKTVSRTPPPEAGDLVGRLRGWRNDAWEKNLWSTAAYWGDKVLTMGGEAPDYYWQAKIYFATGEYARTEYLLAGKRDILDANLPCRYMAALCAIKLSRWDEAAELVRENSFQQDSVAVDQNGIKFASSMWYLGGIVASRMGESSRARECMKKAVYEDPRCIEAFNWLLTNHVLTKHEEQTFVKSIDFSICGPDAEFIRLLYQASTKTYDEQKVVQLETSYKLKGNQDILQRRAERLFEQCKYSQCFDITSAIVKRDPFNSKVVPIHASCLSELGLKNDLFYFAHQLSDIFPERASTWFAVGAYYLMLEKNLEARKYFSKCTQLDGSFGPGWLGFAHSFAAEGETDQAISAYATAAKLFNGMHIPLMHLGMHYVKLKNLSLAEDYLLLAEDINKSDPLLTNELGVLYFSLGKYVKAIRYFERTLVLADDKDHATAQWETTWFNLAQAHRNLRDLVKARHCLEKIVGLNKHIAEAHTLLGYISHTENQPEAAIDHYQAALSFNPEDPIAHDLLKLAIDDVSQDLHKMFPSCSDKEEVSSDYFLPPDLERYRVFQDASPQIEGVEDGGEDCMDVGTEETTQESEYHDASSDPANNPFYTPEAISRDNTLETGTSSLESHSVRYGGFNEFNLPSSSFAFDRGGPSSTASTLSSLASSSVRQHAPTRPTLFNFLRSKSGDLSTPVSGFGRNFLRGSGSSTSSSSRPSRIPPFHRPADGFYRSGTPTTLAGPSSRLRSADTPPPASPSDANISIEMDVDDE